MSVVNLWSNGWMDEDVTWYGSTLVDVDPGHNIIDGVPALHEWGTLAPVFLAHVYCGHGRPFQLLLSSCTNGRPMSLSQELSSC